MDVARDDEVERELSLCGSIGQFAFKITTPQSYGVVREGLRLEVDTACPESRERSAIAG